MPFVYRAMLVAQGLSILPLPPALYVEYSSHGIATTLKAWSYYSPLDAWNAIPRATLALLRSDCHLLRMAASKPTSHVYCVGHTGIEPIYPAFQAGAYPS